MDAFLDRTYRPMLIGREAPPFDSDDYVFELKLDGVRCLAYVDDTSTTLISRSGRDQTAQFPELALLHENIAGSCVLDGELIILEKGVPGFEQVKKRALTVPKDGIMRHIAHAPVVFVVFDLIYENGTELLLTPLTERREKLEAVVEESAHLVLSAVVEKQGRAFFDVVKEAKLEGIIAKRKDSLYKSGKRTTNWIKCKNVIDDDFIICGYVHNKNNTVSLVLGQYNAEDMLVYKGHVVLGTAKDDFATIEQLQKVEQPSFAQPLPAGNAEAIWVEPKLVCRVTFLQRTNTGQLRHPVYESIRTDKLPHEARESGA